MKEIETADYYLGFYMGEFIVNNNLPTLSCGSETSRKTIQVSIGEADHLEYLYDKWHSLYNEKDKELSKDSWIEYRRFNIGLTEKYLPHELICYLPSVEISVLNLEQLKEGMRNSLWNSDFCEYKIKENDDIEIFNDKYNTVVKLKLDLDREIRY